MPLTRRRSFDDWMELLYRADNACWTVASKGERKKALKIARAFKRWLNRTAPKRTSKSVRVYTVPLCFYLDSSMMKGG